MFILQLMVTGMSGVSGDPVGMWDPKEGETSVCVGHENVTTPHLRMGVETAEASL